MTPSAFFRNGLRIGGALGAACLMAMGQAFASDVVTIFNAQQQHDCPPASCEGAYVIDRTANGFEVRKQPGQNVVDLVVDVENGYLRLNDEGTGGGNFVVTVALFRAEGTAPFVLVSANSYDGPAIYNSVLYLARYDRGRFSRAPGVFPHLRPHHLVADAAPTHDHTGVLMGDLKSDEVSDPRDEEFIAYILPRRGTVVRAYLIRFDSTACVKANWLSQPPSRREQACAGLDENMAAMREIRFDPKSGRFTAGPRIAAKAPDLMEDGK